MEWITTANGIITLITGLIGLAGTGVGTYFAIRNWLKMLKTKNSQEVWEMIMEMTDAAMKEAEKSYLKGADKKDMVLNMVKTSCKTSGVNVDLFINQLNNYIDDTISFVNSMKK